MKLYYHFIIFVLTFSVSDCRFGILKEISDRVETTKLGDAVRTLLSCYGHVNAVGIAGIADRNLQKILSEHAFSLVSIRSDTSRLLVDNGSVKRAWAYKLNLFVIEASSSPQLQETFQRIKESKWWNHMATYVLIDWSSETREQGCSNSVEYMRKAWDMNLLNALYVCIENPSKKVLVYSYNPYASKAPKSWRLENTYPGRKNHPWSVFVRDYRPEKLEVCKDLDFDKTGDLSGYEIEWGYLQRSSIDELTEKFVDSVFDVFKFETSITKAFNATPRLVVCSLPDPETFEYSVYRIGMKSYRTSRVLDEFDMPIVSEDYLSYALYGDRCTYPVIEGGLGILTQYRGNMSQLAKIFGVLDKRTRVGLCLVVLLTILFFRYILRQPLGEAILNVCRIIMNSGLVRVPGRSAHRLYLAGIFILVVTIVGIYQGVIASLLTKPKPLKNLETMQDLEESTHTIYIDSNSVQYFTDPKFRGRYVINLYALCINDVLSDPSAACVMKHAVAVPVAIRFKLHASKNVIVPVHVAYRIRHDWPLEERFNRVIAALREAHIYWYLYVRENEWVRERVEYLAEWETNRTDVVMTLSNLGFAFAILGIGLGLATVVFIVELIVKWYDSL